ncbi:MAG: PH domain-containing protein [Bacteroidota bacterium]
MVFQNTGIDTENLPKVEEAEFRGIDKKELRIKLVWLLIWFTVLLIVAISTILYSPVNESIWSQIAVFGGWLFLASLSLLSTLKGFRYKQYALRQHDILYKRGWIWQKMTAIPFNRIQHVSISQGPFERNFKLSNLHVFTAGGSSSDLSIPGLHLDEAQRIKDFILRKSGNISESDLS